MTNKEDKKEFDQRVYCRTCKNQNRHYLLAKQETGEEFEGFFWEEEYFIVSCCGCDTISFVKRYYDLYMNYYNEDDGSATAMPDVQVYPSPPLDDKQKGYTIIEFHHLPPLLDTLYKQVVANYELKYYLLAAAGLRMIIEGICNHLNIKKGYVTSDETGEYVLNDNGHKFKKDNLNGRINGLVEKGVLTEAQTVILHIIRKLGNQTVHQLNDPPPRVIREGLEIIENTFRNVFELEKYEKLRKQYFTKHSS